MGDFKLTTIEEFEEATNRLLETGAKVGADSWQLRVKNQTPHCKFGEQGICCRICSMGPAGLLRSLQGESVAATPMESQAETFCALPQEERPHIPTMAVRSAIPFTRYLRMETTR